MSQQSVRPAREVADNSDESVQLPILVFDGDCGFCTTSARWAERHVGLDNVLPWQSLALDRYGLSEQDCSTAVQWVGRDGHVSGGARAVAAALREGGPGWRVLGRTIQLPVVRGVAEVAYRFVARNRYRLPGSTDACRL